MRKALDRGYRFIDLLWIFSLSMTNSLEIQDITVIRIKTDSTDPEFVAVTNMNPDCMKESLYKEQVCS